MDSSGFSQVGRYGTVGLVKRDGTDAVATSFGVDTEELTFGRDPTCGVRLYYPDVAAIHCKLVFEDRKAFLSVLGESGVLVDGCKVYPHTSETENGITGTSDTPTTIIPLTNNSEFEIHGKRFRFTYPPKEIRATLFATPPRPQGRSLRLSMIHSAQVFSPRPSNDARENLRVLQTPLKTTFKSPVKPRNPSPLKAQRSAYGLMDEENDDEEEDEEIVLVEGNHPQVVQEEEDLIILEDVVTQPPRLIQPTPQRLFEPPRTPPRRRTANGNALHRAVLIRSAQRAVIRAEQEREEEEEELEVMDTVVAEDDEDEDDDFAPTLRGNQHEVQDVEMRSPSDEDEESESEEEDEDGPEPVQPGWRQSLGRIWPFGGSKSPERQACFPAPFRNDSFLTSASSRLSPTQNLRLKTTKPGVDGEEQDADPAPLPSRPLQPQPAIRRPLGAFMTPQQRQPRVRQSLFEGIAKDDEDEDEEPLINLPPASRHSLGGAPGPQRVLVAQPWKVRELALPSQNTTLAQPSPARRLFPSAQPQPQGPSTPLRVAPPAAMGTPAVGGTPSLSQEERDKIRERRRSALHAKDTFFAGGIPGMGTTSPTKAAAPSSSGNAPPSRRASVSPTKPAFNPMPIEEAQPIAEEEEEEEDTNALLEKMKVKVEDMKRRRSFAPSTPLPSRPSIAPPATQPHTSPEASEDLDLTHLTSEPAVDPVLSKALDDVLANDNDDIGELASRQAPEPFSLLRPGEMFSPRKTRGKAPKAAEETAQAPLVIISPDDIPVEEQEDEAVDQPKKRGRPARKPPSTRAGSAAKEDPVNVEPDPETLAVKPTRRTARSRSKSPLPAQTQDEEPAQEPERHASVKPPSTSRSTRKASVEPESQTTATATKRGRRAAAATAAESDVENASEVETKSTKPPSSSSRSKSRGGAGASRKKLPDPISEEEEEEVAQADPEPTPAPAPTKRGRARKAIIEEETAPVAVAKKTPASGGSSTKKRAVKSKKVDVEAEGDHGDDNDNEDPLDSYGADLAEPTLPTKIPAPATTMKLARGRPKKATVAKQEEQETSLGDPPAQPTKPARSTTSRTTTAASKTPNAATTTTKARTGTTTTAAAATRRVKTPATAPAASGSSATQNKENTPGSSGAVGNGNAEADDGPAVKVRISKTRGGASAVPKAPASRSRAVKQEPEESGAAAPARATRTTRVRTKTG